MTRREARESAFILVFEKQFNDYEIEELFELAETSGEIKVNDFTKTLVNGVFSNLEEIDGLISKYLKGWNIKRISKTSLAVLRIAVYEILCFEDVPQSVSINEAVEILKKYATKDDASFVNGVLSSVVNK